MNSTKVSTRSLALQQIRSLADSLVRRRRQNPGRIGTRCDESYHLSVSPPFLKHAPRLFVLYLKSLQRAGKQDGQLVAAIRRLYAAASDCRSIRSVSIDWRFIYLLHILDTTNRLERELFDCLSVLPDLRDLELVGKRLNTNTYVTWPESLQPLRRVAKLERLCLDERGCLRIVNSTAWKVFVESVRRCCNLTELYIGNLMFVPDGNAPDRTGSSAGEQRSASASQQTHIYDSLFLNVRMPGLEQLCIKHTAVQTSALTVPVETLSFVSPAALAFFVDNHPRLQQLTLLNLGLKDQHCAVLAEHFLRRISGAPGGPSTARTKTHRPSLCQLDIRRNRGIGAPGYRALLQLARESQSLLDLEVDPFIDNDDNDNDDNDDNDNSTALSSKHLIMSHLSMYIQRNRAGYDRNDTDWSEYLTRLQQQRPRKLLDALFSIPLSTIYLSFLEHPDIFDRLTR